MVTWQYVIDFLYQKFVVNLLKGLSIGNQTVGQLKSQISLKLGTNVGLVECLNIAKKKKGQNSLFDAYLCNFNSCFRLNISATRTAMCIRNPLNHVTLYATLQFSDSRRAANTHYSNMNSESNHLRSQKSIKLTET